VVEQGTTVEIFERPRHPYTRALMASAFDIALVEADVLGG
jgi:ABC-type dipeptide/oligopeptide/nickel transport system ATPase component